jgi:hypothetical protein
MRKFLCNSQLRCKYVIDVSTYLLLVNFYRGSIRVCGQGFGVCTSLARLQFRTGSLLKTQVLRSVVPYRLVNCSRRFDRIVVP